MSVSSPRINLLGKTIGDELEIIVVSRAVPAKCWRESVEVVRLLRETHGQNATITFCGDGPERDVVLGMNHHWVSAPGHVNDVNARIAGAALLLFLSEFPGETDPLAVKDALAAGRPVVASPVTGLRAQRTLYDLLMLTVIPVTFAVKLWVIMKLLCLTKSSLPTLSWSM